MFSLSVKTAFRCSVVVTHALGLLAFGLLLSLPVNAYPDLSLDESQPPVISILHDSQTSDVKKNFGFIKPGETVGQEIGAGDIHTFQIRLAEGQYLRAFVEQKRIDLVFKVFGPNGKLLREIDNPNGLYGPEAISIITQAAGDYTLEISAFKTNPTGSYELRIEALREPTPSDSMRIDAERLFAEAQELRGTGTKESGELAIEKYKEALALWETLGDVQAQAYTLCNIGRVFRGLGNLRDSIHYLEQALSVLQGSQDAPERAFVLNEIGASYRYLGDPLQSIAPYSEALALRRSSKDEWGQAQLLNNIGLVYWNTGYYRKAIENYDEALQHWRALNERANEANTLNNLGEAYAELSEPSSALGMFEQVLKFCREVESKRLEAYARNNIGKLYEAWAETETALGYYDAALKLFQEVNYQGGEALVLDNIGMAHADAGDTELGIEYMKKSQLIWQKLNERRGASINLTNLGYAYALQKDHQEALKYFNLALPLSRQIHNKLFMAYALLSAGMAQAASGEPQKALEYYQQALDLQREMDDQRGQAITLDKMGQAYASLGEVSKAFENYQQALQRWTALGDRQGQSQTLYDIAQAELGRNNLSESLKKIEEAIQIVESLRTKMSSQRLQLTYFATKQDYYALNIEVRMRLYAATHSEEDKVAALYASEHARARNFLDLLNEARANIQHGAPPELLEKNHKLERDIDAQAESLRRLRNLKWREKAAQAERQLDELIHQYDSLQAKIRSSSRAYADLKQTQLPGLKEIQQLLDGETILLEYSLGERQSYLWVVTPSAVDSYPLPGRAEIERAVTNVRKTLTAFEPPRQGESNEQALERQTQAAEQYWPQAAGLSRMVLGPVSSYPKANRLVVVADGALQYIPFEALPLLAPPSQSNETSTAQKTARAEDPVPLVSRYEVIYELSASALAQLRSAPQKRAAMTVAVIADPVFNIKDERIVKLKKNPLPEKSVPPDVSPSPKSRELSRALRDMGDSGTPGELERLEYSEEEANMIIAAAPARSSLKAVGFKANKATATSPELKQYGIIHFASHGLLDGKHPELSGIVLSLFNEQGIPEDGFLRLHDIYNLELSADLVVLSACQTGIGKQVRGEGLLGLTRGFMYAGAARVLASMWRVNDKATAELMKRFYWHLLKGHKPAATSLRLAQLETMKASLLWRSPYYWAGFVLQGDWK